jgi:NADH:ubiquinone oxidoreductase subunit
LHSCCTAASRTESCSTLRLPATLTDSKSGPQFSPSFGPQSASASAQLPRRHTAQWVALLAHRTDGWNTTVVGDGHSASHWLKPKKPENIVGTDAHGNVYMEDMTTQYGTKPCPAERSSCALATPQARACGLPSITRRRRSELTTPCLWRGTCTGRHRWVLYSNHDSYHYVVGPTSIPPEWHGWLHYMTDAKAPDMLKMSPAPIYVKQAEPSKSGYATEAYYVPKGHRRHEAPRGWKKYQAWAPK